MINFTKSAKCRNFLLLVAVVISLALIYPVFAGHTVQLSSGLTRTSVLEDVTTFFNLSVNNADADESANITQVNITLPSGFTFTFGTNGTDIVESNFTNTSTVLSWVNLTLGSLVLVNGSDTKFFTFNLTASTPGNYNLTITTVNATDNILSNISVSVNDTTSPSALDFGTRSETNATNVSRGNIIVNVTATDNGVIDKIAVTLSNSTTKLNVSLKSSSPFYLNFTGLADGWYNFSATVNDTFGNSNTTPVYEVLVDTTKPLLALGTRSDTNATNVSRGNIYLNVTVTETYESTITFLLANGSGVLNTTSSVGGLRMINFTNLSDGPYHVNVTVNDSAGNVRTTGLLGITIDTTTPLIVFASDSDANGLNTSRTNVYVSAIVNETNENTITFILSNSTDIVNTTSSTTRQRAINFTGLADGTYKVNVSVNDSVAHRNYTITRNITIDATAPTLTFTRNSASTRNTLSITVVVNDSGLAGVSGTCTVDRDEADISVGTTTSKTLTESNLLCGTSYSYVVTCTDLFGNAVVETQAFSTDSCASGGSSGGGSSGGTTTAYSSVIANVNLGVASVASFSSDKATGISQISLEVNSVARDVEVKVTKYAGKPSEVSKEKTGKVYKYVQIKALGTEGKLAKAVIKSQVEKSWLTANNVKADEVSLWKFDETAKEWKELVTRSAGSDATYQYFEADVSSFSFFAIAQKTVAPVVTGTGSGTETTGDETPVLPTDTSSGVSSWILVLIVVFVVVLIGLVILYFVKFSERR